jgi:diguanylate cyclase (GGDEF)-like protein
VEEAQEQLRAHVARTIEACTDAIVGQAVTLLPYAEAEGVGRAEGTRLAEPLLQMLAQAARHGSLAGQPGMIADARRRVTGTPVARAFELVYLLERAVLDELTLDESLGTTSQPWPVVSQIVRRASFDVLAAITGDLGRGTLFDSLTGLYTRGMLLEALDKEIQRAERLQRPFAMLVCDIDRLADLASEHGHGFADLLVERMGIVLRSYFREQDWVARSGSDEFAVLLPETERKAAGTLAEDVRGTIELRLAIRDYRSGDPVPFTVTVAVLVVEHADSTLRARELLHRASQALKHAKQDGGNRVTIVDVSPPPAPGS